MEDQIEQDEDLGEELALLENNVNLPGADSPSESSEDQSSPTPPQPIAAPSTLQPELAPACTVIELSDDEAPLETPPPPPLQAQYNSQHRLQLRVDYLRYKIAQAKLNSQVNSTVSSKVSMDCFSTIYMLCFDLATVCMMYCSVMCALCLHILGVETIPVDLEHFAAIERTVEVEESQVHVVSPVVEAAVVAPQAEVKEPMNSLGSEVKRSESPKDPLNASSASDTPFLRTKRYLEQVGLCNVHVTCSIRQLFFMILLYGGHAPGQDLEESSGRLQEGAIRSGGG